MKAEYSITELCQYLGMKRDSYYYEPKTPKKDMDLVRKVVETFNRNRCVYGQKKLYYALRKQGVHISKERLMKIVKDENLCSKYVLRRKPRCGSAVNKDDTTDVVARKFNNKKPLEVVVSDLKYVNVHSKWHYICLLVELCHREIIGFAAGPNKDADLVVAAWNSVKKDIRNICYFHTDRGGEFKNAKLDEKLEIGKIARSLSRAGTPIDNAVLESMYDIVKTEFIYGETFKSLSDLQAKLTGWVWWYNNERLHSSLGYLSPIESRVSGSNGVTDDSVANKKYQKFWKKVGVHGQKVLIGTKSDVTTE